MIPCIFQRVESTPDGWHRYTCPVCRRPCKSRQSDPARIHRLCGTLRDSILRVWEIASEGKRPRDQVEAMLAYCVERCPSYDAERERCFDCPGNCQQRWHGWLDRLLTTGCDRAP